MKIINLESRTFLAVALIAACFCFSNLAVAQQSSLDDDQELVVLIDSLQADGMEEFAQEFNDMSVVISEGLGRLVVSDVRVDVAGKAGIIAVKTNLGGLEGDLLFVADANQGHFVAFKPTVEFRFSDILGNLGEPAFDAALATIDSIVFDDALLVFANSKVAFNLNDLDNALAADLDLESFSRGGQLGAPAGLSVLGNLDVSGSEFLTMAFAVVGFNEPKVLGRTSIEWSLAQAFKAMVSRSAGVAIPKVSMEIGLPSFKPTFFDQLTLDREFDFTFATVLGFNPSSNSFSTTVSMTSAVDFPIGDDVLATTLALASGYTISPTSVSSSDSITMSLADADGWDNAFGWGFLTIEDFRIGLNRTLSVAAGAAPKVSANVTAGGTVLLGSKRVTASGTAEFGPVIAVTQIGLEVDDGPDQVGSIAMEDLLTLFESMIQQQVPNFQMPPYPGMRLSGLEVGQGPRILLSKSLIDVYGKMTILGQDVVTIERGKLDQSVGVDIYGYATELDLGPVQFPTGEFKVLMTVTPQGIVGPNVRIISSTGSEGLFGASAASYFELTTDGYRVASAFDLGDLFAMSYEYGVSGLPQDATLNDLNNIEASFSGSMDSDVSGWINSSGKDAVRDTFGGLFNLVEQSQRDLETAQAAVDDLAGKINSKNGSIAQLNNGYETCNQNMSVQTCWPYANTYCKKKWRGNCVNWGVDRGTSCRTDTVANAGARAQCAIRNTSRASSIALLVSERASIEALKVTADAAVASARLAQEPMAQAEEIINDILSNLAAPEVFSIQSATVSGALSTAVATGGADDSALDAVIVYTVGGNNQKTTKIRFSMMDAAYTAEQMSKLLADAFVTSLESQLGNDPATKFIVDQARETLRNLN